MGLGELGRLFGRAALSAGLRVTPVLRGAPASRWSGVAVTAPVLMMVGEGALADAVGQVPVHAREHLVLVQNELLPASWQALGLASPTVLVFWSNQKAGRPLEVGRRSAVYGPHAETVAALHAVLEVPCEVLADQTALALELCAKLAFILAINTLGLAEERTVGAWLEADRREVDAVVDDALTLAEARLGEPIDRAAGRAAVVDAMTRLATMGARGRSAPSRLARALAQAEALGVQLPSISALASRSAVIDALRGVT